MLNPFPVFVQKFVILTHFKIMNWTMSQTKTGELLRNADRSKILWLGFVSYN